MPPDDVSEHATAGTGESPLVLEVGPASPEQFHWILDQIEADGEIERFRIEIESDAPVRHPLAPDHSERNDDPPQRRSSDAHDEPTEQSADDAEPVDRPADQEQGVDAEGDAAQGVDRDAEENGDGDADAAGDAAQNSDEAATGDTPRVQSDSETYDLLEVLAERNEWLRTEELNDALPDDRDVDQQTIASLLWQLGDRGLVQKRPYEEDRRKTEYRVTDRGQEAFERATDDGGDGDENPGGGATLDAETTPDDEPQAGSGAALDDGPRSDDNPLGDETTNNEVTSGGDTTEAGEEVQQLLEAMAVWESHLRRAAEEWHEEVSDSAEEYRRGLAERLGVEPEDVPDEAVEHWKEGVMETDAGDLTGSVAGEGSDWLVGIYEGVTGREPPDPVKEVARDVEERALDRAGDEPSNEEILDAVRDELGRTVRETRGAD